MKRPNLLSPDRMTSQERIAEVCEILARGLIRFQARQSSGVSGDCGESPLAMSLDQRRHADHDERHEA